MRKIAASLLAIILCFFVLEAQESVTPVKWRFAVKMTSPTEGKITVTARIEPGWHIYGTKKVADGPVPTSFDFKASTGVRFIDDFTPSVSPDEKFDSSFGLKIDMWEKTVSFVRHFKLTGSISDASIKGSVKFMVCDDKNCMPPRTENFVSKIKAFTPTK